MARCPRQPPFSPAGKTPIWVRPDGCPIDAGREHADWAATFLGKPGANALDRYYLMEELLNRGWMRFHIVDGQLNIHMRTVPNAAQARTLDKYVRTPGVEVGVVDVKYGDQVRYMVNEDGRMTAGKVVAFARKYLGSGGDLGSADRWMRTPGGR